MREQNEKLKLQVHKLEEELGTANSLINGCFPMIIFILFVIIMVLAAKYY